MRRIYYVKIILVISTSLFFIPSHSHGGEGFGPPPTFGATPTPTPAPTPAPTPVSTTPSDPVSGPAGGTGPVPVCGQSNVDYCNSYITFIAQPSYSFQLVTANEAPGYFPDGAYYHLCFSCTIHQTFSDSYTNVVTEETYTTSCAAAPEACP